MAGGSKNLNVKVGLMLDTSQKAINSLNSQITTLEGKIKPIKIKVEFDTSKLKLPNNINLNQLSGNKGGSNSNSSSDKLSIQSIDTHERYIKNLIHQYKIAKMTADDFAKTFDKVTGKGNMTDMFKWQNVNPQLQEKYIGLIQKAESIRERTQTATMNANKKIADEEDKKHKKIMDNLHSEALAENKKFDQAIVNAKKQQEAETQWRIKSSNSLYKQKQGEIEQGLSVSSKKDIWSAQIDKMKIGKSETFNKDNVKAELSSLLKSIESFGSVGGKNIKQINAEMARFRTTVAEVNYELKQTTKPTDNFFKNMGNNLKKFADWMVVGTIFMQTAHTIGYAIQYVYKMDKAMTDLSKVVDLTSTQMKEMNQSAIDMGKSLGKSSVDIMKAYAEFGRQFKNTEDIKKASESAILMSNVTSLSAEQSAKTLSTAMVAFGISAKDSIKIVDSLNEVGCLLV